MKSDGNLGFDCLAVIGVGLLGGSLGLAVKAVDARVRVIGAGRRQTSLDQALSAGVVDAVTLDAAEAAGQADLVVVCAPVGSFGPIFKAIAPALRRGTIVTDVGSTKVQIVRQAQRLLPAHAPFIGSHPMAGGEQQGVGFARADLYQGRTCILTPTEQSRPAVANRVEGFWQAIGMRTVRLAPAEHDRALARVSHLPHAAAALLVNAQEAADLDLAGQGFIDATRIAGGDPQLWRDIFLSNRRAVVASLDRLAAGLAGLRGCIDRGDAEGIVRILGDAQARRAEMLRQRLQRGQFEG